MTVVSNIGRIIPIFRGIYSNTAKYESFDEVTWSNGDTFRVKFRTDPPIGTLPSNTVFWQPITQVGAQVKAYRDEVVTSVSILEDTATLLATQITEINLHYSDIETTATSVNNSFDLFNKKFIGVHAAAPITDNNGDTLSMDNKGAWYFNETDNFGYTWTGTAWFNLTQSANYDAALLTGELPDGVLSFDITAFGKSLVGATTKEAAKSLLAVNFAEIASKPTTISGYGITDLSESVQDLMSTALVAGTNMNVSYNDTSNQITVACTAAAANLAFAPSGSIAATTIQTALVELDTDITNLSTTVAGKMTKSTYDPTNKNADAFSRTNHTGSQTISTITNLQSSLDAKVDKSITVTGAGLATSNSGDLSSNRVITVAKASAAEVLAMESDSKAVTPLGLATLIDSLTYVGNDPDETVFPIGHEILLIGTNVNRNAAISQVRLTTADTYGYISTGTGAVVLGIWRGRGVTGETAAQLERTA